MRVSSFIRSFNKNCTHYYSSLQITTMPSLSPDLHNAPDYALLDNYITLLFISFLWQKRCVDLQPEQSSRNGFPMLRPVCLCLHVYSQAISDFKYPMLPSHIIYRSLYLSFRRVSSNLCATNGICFGSLRVLPMCLFSAQNTRGFHMTYIKISL